MQLKALYQCCTLEVLCNPCKARKTKASWRAPAKYFKAYIRRCKTYKSEYFSTLFHTILLNFIYLLLTYHPPPLPGTMSNPQHPSGSHISTPASQEIEMEDATASNKRTTPDPENTLQKKAKANYTSVSIARDPSKTEFWYGFPAMEAIAYEGGVPPIIVNTPLAELVTSGFIEQEAIDLKTGRMSFPRVPQKLWPTSRPDKIEGQHFNITQLPFDIEVNTTTNLSLDYHILLHFAKPRTSFSQEQVMKKIVRRFQEMAIPLGNQIAEPIAILCHGPRTARVWSGMAKIHLQDPENDGKALLRGARIFAITLDDDAVTVAKIAKSYDPIAASKQLSIKINSETLKDIDAHQLLKYVVEDSFRRGYEFEITQAQKTASDTYGWLTTTSPDQVSKISKYKLTVMGEILQPAAANTDNLSRDGVITTQLPGAYSKGIESHQDSRASGRQPARLHGAQQHCFNLLPTSHLEALTQESPTSNVSMRPCISNTCGRPLAYTTSGSTFSLTPTVSTGAPNPARRYSNNSDLWT